MTTDTTSSALMKAAADLLASEGPEALTVRRIAATAGCSTMGLYSRFGGKDGVVERLWLDGFSRLRAAVEALPVTDDPLHDLEQIGVTYRRWALDNATTYGIMFNRSVPDFAPSAEAMEVSIGTFFLVVDAVRRSAGQGPLPRGGTRGHRAGDLGDGTRLREPRDRGDDRPVSRAHARSSRDRVQGHRGRARRHRRETWRVNAPSPEARPRS